MKCRDVVELMTDYLDGALSSADRVRFEEHIAGCDGCRAYLEQMRATRSLTVKLAEEPIPEKLQDELTRAFRSWRADKGTGPT
jgi:anti-sigma factor RsiW